MNDAKQVMIDKLVNSIRDLSTDTRTNPYLSLGDKITQVDVVLDTIRFLSNYDENVQVLNKYYARKRKEDICRDG